ncbi:MAG: DUF721 domain-containing protein [Deltaproteobacteria bacterium]|nr:DUF721 domain-containing protein [Deltaproteobacteria bacterium]
MKKFTPLSEVLISILKKRKLCDEVEVLKVFSRWEEIVGERLAEHAQPLRIKKKVLYIGVKDPTYLCHMEFMKGTILEKVNTATGKQVEDVKFLLLD